MPGIIPFGAFFIAMFGVMSGFALPRKVRLYSRAMRKAMRWAKQDLTRRCSQPRTVRMR